MKRLSIISLILTLCVHASAEMPKHDPPDPRLDKKVTLEVKHTKLEEVAKSLSEQTGVTIKVGSGQRDWKVRERTVTVCAKDLPLGKALDEISRTLSFYVSREGKQGEWSYIIWQDKKSRDLEAEMVTAQKEAVAKRIKDARQAAVDDAAKSLEMNPDEALKLRDKDPWRAFMGGTKTGRGFAGLISSLQSRFPTEYDLMMRGKRAIFSLVGLPGGIQQYANDATSGGLMNEFKGKMGEAGKDLVPAVLAVMPIDEFNGAMSDAGLLTFSGMMYIGGMKPGEQMNPGNPYGGMPMGFLPLMAPDSLGARVFGELLLNMESGMSMSDAGRSIESKYGGDAMMAQMLAKESKTEKEPPTDPELTREIEIKADALPKTNAFRTNDPSVHEAQGQVLAEISRALGDPVILESFNKLMPVIVHLKPGKQPVYKVLIALEKANYSWERTDHVLRVRPNDWALRRSYLIPESYIAYYKDAWRNTGQLSIDEVASVACSLTDDQITHTLLADPDLKFLMSPLMGSSFGGSRDILRFYGALSANQRQALEAEAGIPFSDLNDAQWDQLNKVITDRFPGVYVTDGFVKSSVEKDETGKAPTNRTFDITVYVSGEQEPRTMNQRVHIPTKESMEEVQKTIKAAQDKAKSQSPDAPTADPDAPKPAPAK